MKTIRKRLFIWLGGMLIVCAIAPTFLPSFYLSLLGLGLIYGIFAMSLDILMGFAGLSSLGHAAYLGIAGYVVGFINVREVLPGGAAGLCIEILLGAGSAAVLALVFGLLTVRTRGSYHMMLTLALGMMLWGVAYKWVAVTGGPNGLGGIKRPDLSVLGLNTTSASGFFYVILIVFAVALLAMSYLAKGSSFGRVLLGIKNNELRMRALGYNVWGYLYAATVIAAAFAGVSGLLLGYYNHYVSPSNLHILMSAQVLLMAILGGSGTLYGPLVGAVVLVFLQDAISTVTDRWVMVMGIIYVLVIVFLKRGIYGTIEEAVHASGDSMLRRVLSLRRRGDFPASVNPARKARRRFRP